MRHRNFHRFLSVFLAILILFGPNIHVQFPPKSSFMELNVAIFFLAFFTFSLNVSSEYVTQVIALLGTHTLAHNGSPPQRSHMIATLLFEFTLTPLYGQASTHDPHPVQSSEFTITIPLSTSFSVAFTGQASMHGGSSHCSQKKGMTKPLLSSLKTCIRLLIGSKTPSLLIEHETTQDSHPVHLLTSKINNFFNYTRS